MRTAPEDGKQQASRERSRARRVTRRDGGFALILAMVVLGLAAGAIGIVAAASARTRAAGSSTLAARTLECGHGGTSRGKVALLGLFQGGSTLDDVIAQSASSGGIVNDAMNPGAVNVTFLDNDDGDGDTTTDTDFWTVMRSRCQIDTSATTVEVMGRGTLASAFNGASCGCSAISFNGSSVDTDSYDSLAGPYNPITNAGTMGNLQGNGDIFITGTVDGDVIGSGNVDGNGTVTGNVFAGGTVDTTNITVLGNVFQNMNPPPQPCRCNGGIDVAAATAQAAASNDNAAARLLGCPQINLAQRRLRLNGGDICTLSSGTYYFEEVRINGGGVIIIDPLLDPTDPTDNVFIYLDGSGPFRFNGNGITNASTHALNLEIYSNSTADTDLRGGAQFSGILYAPFSAVDVGGNMNYYGGIFSDDIQNSGNGSLHFDENLLARQDFLSEWRRRSGTWRIVN